MSVDNGISASISGEIKQTGAQAIQGTPSSNAGTYGFLLTGIVGSPNDIITEIGISANIYSEKNITSANNSGVSRRYSNLFSILSTEQGLSSVTINQKTITPASSIGFNKNNNRYTLQFEASSVNDFLNSNTSYQTPNLGGIGVVSGTTKYFQMTGFYTVGGVYESFVVTISPTSSTVINPKTGHTLINTYVSSVWVA